LAQDPADGLFVSETHPGDSFTVLVSVIDSGGPFILVIDCTADTGCKSALRITSGYAKPQGVIQSWMNRRLTRYLNKKKAARLFRQIKLQLPAAGTNRRHPFLPEADFRLEQLAR
jgi:hypothetical protein